jgi:hypothetical protein
MRTKHIAGRDLKVGDSILFLGRLYEVTHFEPHPGVPWDGIVYPARVACSGGRWGITVEDGDELTILDTTPDPDRTAFARFLDDLLS